MVYINERNDRWTACDKYQVPHLHQSSRPLHDAIEHAQEYSMQKGLEDISVAPSQGKFLSIQCQVLDAKHVLEVGTLGAYSTLWMASASPECKIVTIEIDPEIADIARENIRYAGLEDRIELIVGDAADILPKLAREVRQGQRPKLDFSFIDADKENALTYFNHAVEMTRKRGAVYIDNMIRKGLLADEELAKTDTRVRGMRTATEGVGKDDRVDAVILQTVSEKNYDGFLLAVVK